MESKTILQVLYWIVLAGFLIPTYIHGIQKLLSKKDKVELFKHLGISIPVMKAIAWIELMASGLLLFPASRIFSVPIYIVLLSGALYLHLKHHDTKENTLAPVFVGLHLILLFILTYWI